MLFKKSGKDNFFYEKIDILIDLLERSNLKDLVYILGNKKEIIKRNLIAGIFRGVGIRGRHYYSYGDFSFIT